MVLLADEIYGKLTRAFPASPQLADHHPATLDGWVNLI